MNDFLKNLLTYAGLLLLAAIVTDCSFGQSEYRAGTVQAHHNHAPYVTTSCSGKPVHCNTTYHPAQYRIDALCNQIDYVADLNVGAFRYYQIHDGAIITVGLRRGRWTNHIWLDWLENANPKPDEHATY